MPKMSSLGGGVVRERKPPLHPLSPQQLEVIRFAQEEKGNANLVAVAGSGKTYTLVELCKYLEGDVAFAAFNKKIADEVGSRLLLAGVSKTIKAATFHSFGFSAWRKRAPNVQVDGEKLFALMEKIYVPKNLRSFARQLCSLGKQTGMGIGGQKLNDWLAWSALVDHYDLKEKLYASGDMDDEAADDLTGQGIEWAEQLLRASIDQNDKIIDFDDMIYAPLYHQVSFWKHDWVLIDEAQDTNPVRRMLAREMLRKDGRLVAVGDPRQAIYGFTGATADAMDVIAEEFQCITLPLTVTYRCPKAVVRHAQKWVEHIQAAPSAPEGIVREITNAEFRKLVPQRTDAILCRVTKPLIQLAFDYIRKRIPAHVEGRDIGQSLLTLVHKWNSVRTVGELHDKLRGYVSSEAQKLLAKGQDSKLMLLMDRVDSLGVVMEQLKDDDSVKKIEDLINSIFKDTEGKQVQSITLSTVHKAKGREWDRVYLYGRDQFMPSMFATQLWQIEQEHNLIYVAVTRAKRELIEVTVRGSAQQGKPQIVNES